MDEFKEMISGMKYAVQVVILNEDKTKVLAVSRKNDHNDFGLIGGKVDPTDKFMQDAAKRETKEETGLDVVLLYPIFRMHKDNYMGIAYLCDGYTGEIHTDEPHKVEWVDWEIINQGSFGEYNRLVQKSLMSMGVLKAFDSNFGDTYFNKWDYLEYKQTSQFPGEQNDWNQTLQTVINIMVNNCNIDPSKTYRLIVPGKFKSIFETLEYYYKNKLMCGDHSVEVDFDEEDNSDYFLFCLGTHAISQRILGKIQIENFN